MVEPQAAAVGELIYSLLEKLAVNIGQDIAQNILTSIIVETDSFRLPNVEPATFDICAKLLKTGIDFHKLSENIYWFREKEAAVLAARVLSKCRFLLKDRIVWSTLTRKDLKAVGAAYEDSETIANEMLAIKGVEVAILLREIDKNRLKVHLRSKGKVDVALFAQNYGGGGHADAAACVIGNRKHLRKNLLKKVIELVKYL
jgi:phosphoesterase RecJ-like protein